MLHKTNGRIRWWHLLALLALILGLSISAGSVFAGRLTDTTTGLSSQSPAGASTGQAGTLSARDLAKLTKMERAASGATNAKAAPSRPNDDAYVCFSDPATAAFPGECVTGPILGVDGTIPKAIEMWVQPGTHTNLNGQQSYLLFDYNVLQEVDPTKTTCVTAASVEADTTAG